jgi:thiol-disulfide isomerase/thioredoxin
LISAESGAVPAMIHSHRIWRPGGRRSLNPLWAIFIAALPGFSQDIQWVRSYSEGMNLAKESNRPVLVDFWSEWCLPCRQMDKDVYTDLKLIEAARRFVFIRVDADSDRATTLRFGIKALPMKLFLDPRETILLQVKGFTKASELLDMMKQIPESFEPVPESPIERSPAIDQTEKIRSILEQISPGLASRRVPR